MTVSAKLLLLLTNKETRNKIIAIGICVSVFLLMLVGVAYNTTQNASEAANIAVREYNHWQTTSPANDNLSCQGEKYCSYFNYGVVDWCCFFVGYCYKEAGIDINDSGFDPVTNNWTANLESNNKLHTAASGYTPKVGNCVFFNYSGRANYAASNFVAHIGIVVEVDGNNITVIAGNEYQGQTSNWASVSYVNKYTLSMYNDTIACYGDVGSSTTVTITGLNGTVRNVICHNEVGILYDDITNDYYGSVIANDNGAISIGVYGWHANKALLLLEKAYNNNSVQISAVATSFSSAGNEVMSAIRNGDNWSSYIPGQSVCSCIKAMLLTDAGKQAQDSMSLEDAQSYIQICQDNGLTDSKCIAYCSDILNQYGTASFNANVYGNGYHGVLYGVTGSMSLDEIYNSQRAWADSNYSYTARRSWTYNYLKNNTQITQVSLRGTLAE
ncbi:MAG: CHAP domain-containing protein [Ruminococcus sp.]|nr:CHAP domain-containing protein [Ruminococcus sp.]